MTAVGTIDKQWRIHIRRKDRKTLKPGMNVMLIPVDLRFRKASELVHNSGEK